MPMITLIRVEVNPLYAVVSNRCVFGLLTARCTFAIRWRRERD